MDEEIERVYEDLSDPESLEAVKEIITRYIHAIKSTHHASLVSKEALKAYIEQIIDQIDDERAKIPAKPNLFEELKERVKSYYPSNIPRSPKYKEKGKNAQKQIPRSIKTAKNMSPNMSNFGGMGKGYSFGNSPRSPTGKNDMPGPNYYSPRDTLLRDKQPGFKMKARLKSKVLTPSPKSPGPAFYSPDHKFIVK